ncbi:hypothetical protein P153DRAFT_382361 [Dothidotthia symphoricarpi CBS 119687]|uniref:Uncharacterized protein n=1 Tax=Dothidotthia symphoricarpi CBS 119687 TaxID=1392245 RepID=A0A6A6ALB1_9PLEO|nr:uncharacterized protein P153DRAFT_382361 [Dothidotthia symphoricarpi CBS 119687]KAF2132739.1 hypothetical protein P153DRAFT_382361 [Dothidotthia symphoricarpi CBS 119687]
MADHMEEAVAQAIYRMNLIKAERSARCDESETLKLIHELSQLCLQSQKEHHILVELAEQLGGLIRVDRSTIAAQDETILSLRAKQAQSDITITSLCSTVSEKTVLLHSTQQQLDESRIALEIERRKFRRFQDDLGAFIAARSSQSQPESVNACPQTGIVLEDELNPTSVATVDESTQVLLDVERSQHSISPTPSTTSTSQLNRGFVSAPILATRNNLLSIPATASALTGLPIVLCISSNVYKPLDAFQATIRNSIIDSLKTYVESRAEDFRRAVRKANTKCLNQRIYRSSTKTNLPGPVACSLCVQRERICATVVAKTEGVGLCVFPRAAITDQSSQDDVSMWVP